MLETPTWTGPRIIEFQGPADYTFGEIAAQFATALGREVKHIAVTPEAAIDAMVGMGMSRAYATGLTKIFTSIHAGILKLEFARGDPRVRQSGSSPFEFAEKVLKPLVNAA